VPLARIGVARFEVSIANGRDYLKLIMSVLVVSVIFGDSTGAWTRGNLAERSQLKRKTQN
jgi:hypothetical protein